jgi:rod shape-determining protein MreC
MYRRSTKQRVALVALLAATATVLTLDFRLNPGGPVRRVQEVAVSVVAPLQDGLARIFEPIGNFLSSIGEMATARRDNEVLRERIRELESSQRRVPEIVRENERLRALLESKDWASGETRGARVIGVGPSNQEWTAFIDVGSEQGIETGMAVVAAEGLVGRVVLVSPKYSKVLLLVDPDHGVGARLTESGETGVLTGKGDSDLRFTLIDPLVTVTEGETVVTSGFDRGIYPPGIPIGRVTSSAVSPSGLEQTAFVSPFVQFGRLDNVLILLESGPVDRQ